MTRLLAVFCTCLAVICYAACAAEEAAPAAKELEPGPTTPLPDAAEAEMDMNARISYAIGLNTARFYKKHGVELDPAMILRGVQDAITDAQPMLSNEQIAEAMKTLHNLTTKAAAKTQTAQAEQPQKAPAVRQEEVQFLAANAAKEGVVVRPSGLQYKVLKPGQGVSPGPTDTVTVHYRGRTIDGTEFDSSYKRGEPTEFQVNGVIKGFSEALQLMNVGAKWEIYLPAELAYGRSVLIFELELLGIKK